MTDEELCRRLRSIDPEIFCGGSGTLYAGGTAESSCYVAWDPGESEVALRGMFVPEQLEAIASWIAKHSGKEGV